jgi:hypothetical protein
VLKQSFSRAQAGTQASVQAVQNPEVQLQELNPPVPPQAAVLEQTLALDPVPLAIRRQRVSNGSKRRRDIAAVRMAEELELLERAVADPGEAAEAWRVAAERLRNSVPESTYRLWLEPLSAFALEGDTLILAAPEGIRNWTKRRYSHLICEALRGTEFSKIRLIAGGEG